MENATLLGLCVTAASLGLIHTILGPDHYLPFIAMSKAGRWSIPKTMLITLGCGIGHVLGSVILGCVGIALGLLVGKLEWFESMRGNWAGWLLLGFGIAYMIWGIRQSIRNKPHKHWHVHDDGTAHVHDHAHTRDHAHAHVPSMTQTAGAAEDAVATRSNAPWVLFIIFVLGPCEPLIPLLMYPAAQQSWWGVVWVAGIFSVVTVTTMMMAVWIGCAGLKMISLPMLERHAHSLAGFAIALCGLAIQLGL